jgi:hypothetical protein
MRLSKLLTNARPIFVALFFGAMLASPGLLAGAFPEAAYAQAQSTALDPRLQQEIDRLNADYKALAEASCGLRQTDIPGMGEIVQQERNIKDSLKKYAADSKEYKSSSAVAAFYAASKELGATKYGTPGFEAASKKYQDAIAAMDKAREAAAKRLAEEVERLIVRNPKVQCPTPATPATAPQPVICADCKAIDEEIARLQQLLAETEYAGIKFMADYIKSEIRIQEKKRAECQSKCAPPPRTTPPTKKSSPKHSTKDSRSVKAPPATKQPGVTIGIGIDLGRERERRYPEERRERGIMPGIGIELGR